MNTNNGSKLIELQFRAVVRSVDWHAQEVPSKWSGWNPPMRFRPRPARDERNVAMRTRAYRPEVSGCLENRSLLSGVAGTSSVPIVLTRREFNQVPEEIQEAFLEFRQGFGIEELHTEILDAVAPIPFGQADGLGSSITRILKTMQRDIHGKDPQAITSAHNDVIAVTRADMQALAQAGTIVVR
jgi:hypothetical protein